MTHAFYNIVFQIDNAKEESDLREVAGEHIDLLLECGFTKPISWLNLEGKPELIQAVTLHKVILSSLAELDQFRTGMAALGVAESLKQYYQLYIPFYCMGAGDVLTSGSYV